MDSYQGEFGLLRGKLGHGYGVQGPQVERLSQSSFAELLTKGLITGALLSLPWNKVGSIFFLLKSVLRGLNFIPKIFGSSLYNLTAIFYSQKTQECVIRSLGQNPKNP